MPYTVTVIGLIVMIHSYTNRKCSKSRLQMRLMYVSSEE